MFKRARAEARYLAATRTLTNDFEIELTKFLSTYINIPGNARTDAKYFVDNYLEKLFKEVMRHD